MGLFKIDTRRRIVSTFCLALGLLRTLAVMHI
jgi:hypothetical protein